MMGLSGSETHRAASRLDDGFRKGSTRPTNYELQQARGAAPTPNAGIACDQPGRYSFRRDHADTERDFDPQ
jgi:hypothetical protein